MEVIRRPSRAALAGQSNFRSRGLVALFVLCSLLAPVEIRAGQDPAPTGSELRIIIVSSQSEAEKILRRLQAGEDFAALARQNSLDPSASDGGSLGRVDPKTLRTELRDALQGSLPGQIKGPIKVPTGYAILRVEGAIAPNGSGPTSTAPSPSTPPVVSSGQGMSPTALLALAGRGKISYPPDVSGAVEVEVAFKNLPKPPDWDRDLRTVCEVRKQTLALAISHLKELLDPNDPESYAATRPEEVGRVRFSLAQLFAYQGDMDSAIPQWLEAYKLAAKQSPKMVPELEEVLGTAYLHKSEMENDVYRKPGDRCLFPPRKPVRYQKTQDSERAVQYLTRFLEKKPDTLEVKWLLNLAYMTLGKYPSGVPAKYLIAPSVFQSKESKNNIGRFGDVAPAAGLNSFSMAGGVIVDDFDNDGLLDVVTSSYDQCEHLHFFHNNGDGTFTDRAIEVGLGDQLGGLNLIQTDYNNDGCLDIFVLRGGWQMPIRPSLLRNNCDGTFTDVTQSAGLADPIASQTAVWADIDNDGLLDLFIGNEQGRSRLYHNNGDGTFENIAPAAGVDRVAFSKGVVAADYDNDGFVDFYVSNLGGDNFLYRNNHDRTFTEAGKQAGVQAPWMSFATWFFDYDNDGFPDLFVTSYYMSTEENLRSQLGLAHNVESLKLYHNEGNGKFRDVTAEAGLDRVFNPMGANFGDLDNDGFLDFYLGTGTPPYGDILPNVLLHNQGGKKFVDVTTAAGMGELHKGHGVAFADLDNDGDEDIVAEIGGAVPGDKHAIRLFENPGNSNDWISLRLVGAKSNRPAIGARIKVTVHNEGNGERFIYRTVGSGGSFGASPLQQHIGLGKGARILNIEIWWPATDTRQNFQDVAKNQWLEITEFGKEYKKLERQRVHLGGKARAASGKEAAPASSIKHGRKTTSPVLR